MPDRVHPLAVAAAATSDCPAAQLAILPAQTRLIIHGEPRAVAALGLTPPAMCRAVPQDGCTLLWLGPDEFLLLAPDTVAMPAGDAAVVDVSHRDVALAVTGPRAASVINAFCALDLDQRAFPVGMCTRTRFAKAEILLWRTEADCFRIDVARSFAAYVWACLEEARREFLG